MAVMPSPAPPTQGRIVAVVPPRKAVGKTPACNGAAVIQTTDGKPKSFKLETLDDVRLFLRGIFPTKWRRPEPAEDISQVIPLHQKWRKIDSENESQDSFSGYHKSQLHRAGNRARNAGNIVEIIDKVADTLIGVMAGNTVVSFLGSTGKMVLAGAIHRIDEGLTIFGVGIHDFRNEFPDCADEARAEKLATLFATQGTAVLATGRRMFHPVTKKTLPEIQVATSFWSWWETQLARIACGNQVHARTESATFEKPTLFGSDMPIAKLADQAMETDPTHMALMKQERDLNKVLEDCLAELPIYQKLRARVKGFATSIGGRIIANTGTIARFPRMGNARSYWGLAVRDGRFMSRANSAGKSLGYAPHARQGFFLFGTQIMKGGAEAFWCERFATNRAMYATRHPHSVLVEREKRGDKWVETGRRFELAEGTFAKHIPEGRKTSVYTFVGFAASHTGDSRLLRPANGNETITVEHGFILYSKGHLLKMSLWRTLTEFGDWLYWFWRSLEDLETRPPKVYPPEDKDAVEATAQKWFDAHPAKWPKKATSNDTAEEAA